VSAPNARPPRASAPEPRRSRARGLGLIGVVLLSLAPVPGDIGACGQPVQELDATKFFESKQAVDCERCDECGIDDKTCTAACDGFTPTSTAFPEGCVPVVHDGEVCLRALLYASCSDYGAYVADSRPTVPTECNFCPGVRP
jgi:hypothetical protein